MRFSGGKIYEGQWKDNKMNGKGVFRWPDGRKYEGEFANDKRNGFGILELGDGRVYQGNFKDGLQQGEGRCKNRNQEWVDCIFNEGKLVH
jgi:hypothetical protein